MSELDNFTDEELRQLLNNPELRALFEQDLGDFPEPPSRDSLLKFFREILNLKAEEIEKISRTGNLKEFELGSLPLSVRNYLGLAHYCDTEGLGSVQSYMNGQAAIVFNSSLSRMAALLKLVVTQRKQSGFIQPKSIEERKGLFGSTTVESGGDDVI